MSIAVTNLITKSLNHFIDNEVLNQPNGFKSITNCLKNDLGKLMSKLDENVNI